MTSADMQQRVARKPFVPLRIFVGDETIHDIRNRELVWVGTGQVTIVVPIRDRESADKPLLERTIYIDLRHIVKVETIAAQSIA